jgi:hypothetical protein
MTKHQLHDAVFAKGAPNTPLLLLDEKEERRPGSDIVTTRYYVVDSAGNKTSRTADVLVHSGNSQKISSLPASQFTEAQRNAGDLEKGLSPRLSRKTREAIQMKRIRVLAKAAIEPNEKTKKSKQNKPPVNIYSRTDKAENRTQKRPEYPEAKMVYRNHDNERRVPLLFLEVVIIPTVTLVRRGRRLKPINNKKAHAPRRQIVVCDSTGLTKQLKPEALLHDASGTISFEMLASENLTAPQRLVFYKWLYRRGFRI